MDHTEAKYTSDVAAVREARAALFGGQDSSVAPADPDAVRQRRLILWLAGQPDGFHAFDALYAGDGEAPLARQDIDALSQRALVDPAVGGGPSLATVQARILPAGREVAADLTAVLGDRSRRQWACREALLRWLYQMEATGTAVRAQPVTGLLRDDLSIFVVERYTPADVDRASGWLYRNDLIDGPTADEVDGPINAFILDAGVTCIEDFDGDLRRYRQAMSSPSPAAPTGHVFNVSATNVQLATGDRAQQTMNVSQVPERIVNVIDGLVEIMTALGAADGREAELRGLRDDAVADVTTSGPTAGGVRRFRDWVIECVKQGGTSAVVAAVTAASNGMLHDAEALARAMGA